MIKTTRGLLAGLALVALPLLVHAGEVATSDGGVSYVTGGASDEERDKLEAMSGKFNVKMTHAMQNGDYVADVKVRIVDGHGKALITTVTEGPFMYAQLPAGTYTIECSLNGKEQKQTVRVENGKRADLKFTWTS